MRCGTAPADCWPASLRGGGPAPPDFRIDLIVRRLADLDRALRRLTPAGQAGRLTDELDEFRRAAS